MIEIIRLYQDFGVPFQTAGHKHVSRGWVGVPCPFCTGNPGYHLGYCVDPSAKYSGAFVCWRCGGKGIAKALSRLLSVTEAEAWKIVGRYSTKGQKHSEPQQIRKKKPRQHRVQLPAGTSKLDHVHRAYLDKRGYDPDKLERLWDLQGTGPVGPYKHRIIIPITYLGEVVSYQGRDITNRSGMKYKACPQDLEVREHKHCLYGLDKATRSKVVVTEGVADVWRLGRGAVATFGIKFTQPQVNLLKQFSSVFVLFDTDPEAVEQASSLSNQLSSFGIDVEIIELDTGDPGDLTQQEADDLMSEILGQKNNP